jgi:hypothetical protein
LKYFILPILLFILSLHCGAQNFELQLTATSSAENKIIDSLNYTPRHKNLNSLRLEIETTSQRLSNLGYIENTVTERHQANDSTYIAKFHLGTRIKFVHIHIGKNKATAKLLSTHIKQDSIFLQYADVENFLQQNTIKLEKEGYSLAKVKLTNIQKKGNTLFTELQFESENRRQLNAIVIKHSEDSQQNNFPKGHLTQISRRYKNKVFNQDIVSKINSEFEKFGFVNQIKYPEVLFTEDSTKVYVYLQKRKSNTFDGFIGFSNNENKKLTLNGYLDLSLQNTLHVGEQFSLYWKTDGNGQRTFKTSLELPYLFTSPIGLKGELNIFKQDSTFQNTKTAIDISYFVNYDTRIYLGYQSTVSSDIQNAGSSMISDYTNSFVTANLDYSYYDSTNSLFLKQSTLLLKTGSGNREMQNQAENSKKNKQFFLELQAILTFNLNSKNNVNIKTQNYYLHSSNYFTNELYRFGGINSIRGFIENSLTANFMTSILTEYRYVISPSLYFHTILDYCRQEGPAAIATGDKKNNLLGIGIGLGAQTKAGLLKISMANGSSRNEKIKFSNTIIHLSYNVKF